MPTKSRRNRRVSSQRRTLNRPADAVSADSGTATTATLPSQSVPAYSSKAATASEPASKYVLGEIKWIGVVTLIVIIVLIVLFIFIR
jgi:hypothetical protein